VSITRTSALIQLRRQRLIDFRTRRQVRHRPQRHVNRARDLFHLVVIDLLRLVARAVIVFVAGRTPSAYRSIPISFAFGLSFGVVNANQNVAGLAVQCLADFVEHSKLDAVRVLGPLDSRQRVVIDS